MSDLDNVGSTKDLIAGYKAKIERLQETVEELSNKNKEFIKQSHHTTSVFADNVLLHRKNELLESENKALRSEQAKQPTMYEVTFHSYNTEDFVLDLPFIPKKGNVFEFVSPLISINRNHGNDDYFLKVKSVGVSIDKDGKVSKINIWCKSY